MTFGTEKLEWWVYLVVKNVFKMFTRFDRIHERDGQTDTGGATENAGLELNGPTKFGGWKMQDWN